MSGTPGGVALTREEKARLTSGADFWTTAALPHAEVPALLLTDGPHGVRRQRGSSDHLGIADSERSTCFPPAVAMASTWDPDLVRRVGEAIGAEAAAAGVAVLLGPGINIKRSPLCGRNFEYYSEDPLLAGRLGAAAVAGIQSRGVAASLKHFAANNQETDRLRISSDVDERPLREIYLRPFERVVRAARPWTVMCSYNRINGVFASEDPWLLTTVLRDEWGFDGVVVSDWGAVYDRVAGLSAGMDLEMPSSGGRSARRILEAIDAGSLDETVLDAAASRVLRLVERTRAPRVEAVDISAHHALAREAAARALVLLRNERDLLPLTDVDDIGIIGAFAAEPRYQGAGSSRVNPTRVDTPLEAIRTRVGRPVPFAPGFTVDGTEAPAHMNADAVALAGRVSTVLVFLGLPAALESEGFDREHLDLPAEQLRLLDEVLAMNERVVVVLGNGGVVLLPFADRVPAILETWLPGQAGGTALADVLFGDVSPSGRLAETIPLRLEDTPAFLDFPGEHGRVRYGEGIHVGYRWYDARRMAVAFPFGHGLTYGRFTYGEAVVRETAHNDVVIHVPLTNVGSRAARETVQVYAEWPSGDVVHAPRELVGFGGVTLAPGESAVVAITVPRADLAYWDTRVSSWIVPSGPLRLHVGASSRDLRSMVVLMIEGDHVGIPISIDSSIGEAVISPARAIALRVLGDALSAPIAELTPARIHAMEAFTLRRLLAFPSSTLSEREVEDALASLPGHPDSSDPERNSRSAAS
jgi:beta-glucosidase